MSNVSIYEKNWTDLVFEDKNKAYGAYQLRQENPRTTLLAFFVGTAFILSLIGSWLLLSSFSSVPDDGEINDPGIIIRPVDLLDPPITREKPVTPVEQLPAESQPMAEPTTFAPMVPAATPEAVNNVPTNDNLPTNKNNDNSGAATGIGTDRPNEGGNSTGFDKPAAPSGPVSSAILDKLPEYPGGIKKFYDYVSFSIERSELENSAAQVSVIMSFVIEKDGSMTDIKVLRSSDKALEKEAIRVLKALKVKWAPGYLNGERVRTQYSLPIKVAI